MPPFVLPALLVLPVLLFTDPFVFPELLVFAEPEDVFVLPVLGVVWFVFPVEVVSLPGSLTAGVSM